VVDIEKSVREKFPKIKQYPPVIRNGIIRALKAILYEKPINDFLEKNDTNDAMEFIERMLDHLDFTYKVSMNELENIPTSGRVVIIANHPLGILDALSLLHMVKKIRPDVKIVANDLLSQVEQLRSIFLTVDVFGNKISKESIQQIYDSLEREEAIIVFPSGEVSRSSKTGIKDTKWQKGFLKFAMMKQAPILPVYIKAKNSWLFYTVSMINKQLSTFLLLHEMFNKRGGNLEFVIGQLIPFSSFKENNITPQKKVALFRDHLYRISKGKSGVFATVKGVAHPEDRHTLKEELQRAEHLGETRDGKIIYLFDYFEGSSVIKEIGRLREISFRKVDEGTNEKRDLDQYDTYYRHIVLWDENDLEIVGAYRIAEGKEVLKRYGREGFYTHTLFEFQDAFIPYLNQSIELGRSFVQPKYWGSYALEYLWYGIGAYLKKRPEIRYLYGPVSLSASLPTLAKDMIVSFYKHYFGAPQNDLVKAVNPFHLSAGSHEELEHLIRGDYKNDFRNLRSALRGMGASVPVLYKQYSELCEPGGMYFYDFNIDPNFSDCIDGFIMVDLTRIKPSKQKYLQ
jgi:putative hemolysin